MKAIETPERGRKRPGHPVVSREEWLSARLAHLAREKAFTRQRDELLRERRELPWVKVEKEYAFEAPEGLVTLADLFNGRSQLIVKHFMMPPGQANPCVGCSFEMDHVGGALVHLENHDVSFAVVARAPIGEIEVYRRRMEWRARWVSSFGGDFNYDFHASFTKEQLAVGKAFYNYRVEPRMPLEDLSGFSVFYKDDNAHIFHTYSAFGRGAEEVLTTYMFLDMTPKGRNETGPSHNLTDWVRPHDRYGMGGSVDPKTGRYHPSAASSSCCAPTEFRT
ncbi:MAG: DUF899 domain-containing protein [Phycisphaerales bacterium]